MDQIDPIKKRFNKPTPIPTVYTEAGKIPPQAVDLEEAVLGALMLEKDAINDIIDILSPDSFYKPEHGKIYSVIREMFNEGHAIDILTVTQSLKKKGELEQIGGPFFISQLTNRVASAANVEQHARIISQKFIQRKLIEYASDTITNAFDETKDVFDLLDKAEQGLFTISENNIRKNWESMNDLLIKAIKHLEEVANNQGTFGVPTGFKDLDKITGGFQNSDMIVLAARPGMGKTAFSLTIARNAAVDYNMPVAVFSLEMSSLQLVNRLIASETEINGQKLKRGTLEPHEWTQLKTRISKLAKAPMFIDDTPGLPIYEFRAKCRRLKLQHDIKLVIVDYLQLMTTGGEHKGNREQEISNISRSIKGIAKELNVPIIALSQLSRDVEKRPGEKRPQLSDLRESGAIEQDADMVMFIYRPEYYGETETPDGDPTNNLAIIEIAKNRHGSTTDVKLQFIKELAKFSDLNSDSFQSYNASEGMGNVDLDLSLNSINPSIIKESKMNTDFDLNENPPF